MALTCVVSSSFYIVHVLEDNRTIPKILSHGLPEHPPLPFANAPMEELVGAAVLGAWVGMLAGARWRTEACWTDRIGRVLGLLWIGMFLVYIYGYTG
jgi:hypothetical protein